MRAQPTRMLPILAILALAAWPAAAEEFGYQGWGVRLGVADDPDQGVAGLHLDLGEIVDRLRLAPNLELGLGDDHTILTLTIPVHYRFAVEAPVRPYAGGGLALGFVDRDLRPPRREAPRRLDLPSLTPSGAGHPAGGQLPRGSY